MKFSKVLLAAAILPQIALQATEIPYYYDYGYPPPVSYVESFGTVVVGAEWLYMKPAVDGELFFRENSLCARRFRLHLSSSPKPKLGFWLSCESGL